MWPIDNAEREKACGADSGLRETERLVSYRDRPRCTCYVQEASLKPSHYPFLRFDFFLIFPPELVALLQHVGTGLSKLAQNVVNNLEAEKPIQIAFERLTHNSKHVLIQKMNLIHGIKFPPRHLVLQLDLLLLRNC